jgi:tRNA modification GTPase
MRLEARGGTIIAVSTPPGPGGIGVVRLSGSQALPIARRFFAPQRDKCRFRPREAVLGRLVASDGRCFDEAILTYFPGPRSYTREDVVEISCHGSPAVLEEAVRLGVKAGARRAEPGEFTLRAFLNGRIDILQAEAVQSLVAAGSLAQAELSYAQLAGRLSSRIRDFRGKIVRLAAEIEARLEFPEEPLQTSPRRIANALKESLELVNGLVESYEAGRLMTEGMTLAIVGRPNVGKSTLFNALVGGERAIVTPAPGTTRDFLKETVKIGDNHFSFVDMAGLAETSHPVEKEGVRRGWDLARAAQGVLFLFDSSKKEDGGDLALLRRLSSCKGLVVFNKLDLPRKINKVRILAEAGRAPSIAVSALKGTNIPRLKDKIGRRFAPNLKEWDEIILHSRQAEVLRQVKDGLQAGLTAFREGGGEEILAEEIRRIIPCLGRLTGEIKVDDVLNDVFARFCVGK